MSEEKSVVGSYRVEASTDLSLIARGDTMTIRAISETGNVLVDGSLTVSIMSGESFLALQNDEAGASVVLSAGELGTLTHCVGPPLAGAQIQMTPELVTISVGPVGEGSSIVMTAESITFKVGETTLTMTPAGIVEAVAEVTREVTAEGHNLTAGESDFNFGVSGLTLEAPSRTEEIEGGAVLNATMENRTIEAVKEEEASLEVVT